ncbi:hypothetical protein M404DRAFT_1007509 [Pisolithus tinctorius Marx 270]|uniref:Uncharacterized protein n=1 Tax=Pisolithus tinctorius Marx 270 TaxID=870435 RepID=A0A0C3JCK6_PISTI|nr:hypothetical protein M404DRAFT_1007509 [Pisolithus tinctorius Marx 270]
MTPTGLLAAIRMPVERARTAPSMPVTSPVFFYVSGRPAETRICRSLEHPRWHPIGESASVGPLLYATLP